MLALIGYYWIWLLLAFLIGLATAWWVWGSRSSALDEPIVWPQDGLRHSGALVTFAPPAGAEPQSSATSEAEQQEEEPMLLVSPLSADSNPAPLPAEDEPAPLAQHVTALQPIHDTPDDLTIINGIGPQLNTLLGSLGITRFNQIADWSAEDIERIDSHLGVFRGRIARDDWPAQARLLAAGDMATFWERYGQQ